MAPSVDSACVDVTLQTDKQLLEQFLNGDEQAFAAVVERHAGMVRAVCQRVLRNANDCDDAFQATFFVLASRAKSIAWQDSIGGWLHQVARRVSLRLKSDLNRRRSAEAASAMERQAAVTRSPAGPSIPELGELLDRELAQLPDRFREVIVLTQAEGLSRTEAAARLGISAAAVKDRLERGRELLRKRLLKRGLTLSSVTIAAWLVPSTANATGIQTLVATTAPMASSFAAGKLAGAQLSASATLAQGVLNMMGLQKASVIFAFLLSVITGGSIAYGILQDNPNRFDEGLRGTLVRIDADDTPSLTIALDEYQTLLDLDISSDAKVWIAYEATELAQLKVGQFIAVQLESDHRKVKEIHGRGEIREGTVKALGESGTLLIEGDDDNENAPLETLELSPNAIVRIGGLPATRDELRPGMSVPLEFGRTGEIVHAIEFDGVDDQILEGEIAAVDLAKGEVTLNIVGEDDQTESRALTFSPSTIISLDGKSAQPSALAIGCTLRVRLAEDKKSIQALQALTHPTDNEASESDD